MKKTLVAAAMMLASTQAFAGDFFIVTGQSINLTIVSPTVSSVASSISTAAKHNKELMVAAQDDAAMFLAAEGQIEKSILLRAALKDLSKMEEAQGLNDLEMAELVIVLAN